MIHATMLLVAALSAAMEVSNEPVAYVVNYGEMENITLKAEDVMVFSLDIPQVESVEGSSVSYAKRSMAEMMAANVPEEPPESKPTLPNESRFKKRLDHTPPFTGTVTGTVSIVKNAPNQRIILVSDIQGDGLMQVLVKGATAEKPTGEKAKAIMNTPYVLVRNSKEATEVGVPGATPKELTAADEDVRQALESHYKGAVPANIRIVSETVTVE